ncbi:MAG: glutamine-hydrolyzing carbamoyl-phosphate synthase small subunit [Victivallaceae bacterium]|nr:glutamine-hydrolyzing carbamoyl-phosphate synthase small subunit [Victivallaceae bacterium]
MDNIYNWQAKRERKAFIALADGEIFHGWSFGAMEDCVGEVVFNTGMSGYQEIISDPSYAGQMVALTMPEIGNYGCNRDDMESRKLFLNALIVHNLNEPSNFRSELSLAEMLKSNGIPGIAGVDTRRLTLHLRKHGTQKAYLHVSEKHVSESEGVATANAWCGLDNQDYAAKVTVSEAYDWNNSGRLKVVALDFGIKYNILRQLSEHDMQVKVLPAQTRASEILGLRPDGVFLSNGPADPSAVRYAVDCIRELDGKVPVMGICLGHQLLGLALGAECQRLRFGHHGCNHPVKNLAAGTIEITSQNHNFSLKPESLPDCLEVTHLNLNDHTIEGIRHCSAPAFSVQYHPEAAPGPHDSHYLFHQFKTMMEG